MSDELQQPPVVDLDALLQPVSEESPAGESLRYSGLYDEISEARRADVDANQGDWQTELKVADFRKVVDLAVPDLATTSKDLQIAVWLSEALININSFAGLRDSLKLVAGLQEKFWETLHPEIDEGDMEGRANAIAWLDLQGAKAVRSCPLTAGAGYGYADWQDAKRFDIPSNLDSLDPEAKEKFNELKTQAEAERRVTADMWKSALAQSRRPFFEKLNYTIDECWTALEELNRVIDDNFDRNQTPGLSNLKKAIDEVHGQAKKLLEKKRLEEPSENDVEEVYTDEVPEDGEIVTAPTSGGSGPMKSRPEALKRLAEIAAYFQRTEPHSPVAYLIQRAVKWGNMPLETWLRDVIKDENVLFQLRETLGLDSAIPAPSGDWESADDTTSDNSTTESSSDDW